MSVPGEHVDYGIELAARRAARSDTYRTRMMLSLAISLGLATALLRIPLRPGPQLMGWDPRDSTPLIQVSQDQSSVATRHDEGSVEAFGFPDAGRLTNPDPSDASGGADSEDASRMDALRMRVKETIYEHVDSPPEIRGGLGAYYINIRYPEEAVREGIEGRLMLRFVVDTEGRPTEISVRKSLHPLCDSAAVQALRVTRFVAGSQNGTKVPVRMHLPVRFKLVEAGTLASGRRDSL